MTKEEIIKNVNQFLIDEIEVDEEKLVGDALLGTDLGIDSLDFVDIVVLVEKNFGFKIKPEEMTDVKTLSHFYNYIASKVAEK
jgi:acyl carrier protein